MDNTNVKKFDARVQKLIARQRFLMNYKGVLI